MKNKVQIIPSIIAAAAIASPSLHSQVENLKLEVYRTEDLQNWQRVTLLPEDVADGAVIVPREGDIGMFRLGIERQFEAWGDLASPEPVAFELLPESTRTLAEEMLVNLRRMRWTNPHPWPDADPDPDPCPDPPGSDGEVAETTVLAPYAYPIYDPAIDGGNTPAYYEIPFVPAEPAAGELPPNPLLPGGHSPNARAGNYGSHGLGYIRLSNTRMIEPVTAFATSGPSPVEQLRGAAGGQIVRPVLYSAAYLVGENPAGELVAALGNHPFNVDIEPFQQLLDPDSSHSGTDGDEVDPGTFPGYEGEPQRFASYQEFKAHYLASPVRQFSRLQRGILAAKKWRSLVDGELPAGVTIEVGETRQVLVGNGLISVEIDHNHRVAADIIPGDGLSITGLEAGFAQITARREDGTEIELVVTVTAFAFESLNRADCVQLPYRIEGARNWFSTPRYTQYKNYSQLCHNGWSGCGPAAWTILFGHWDRAGVPQAMGDALLADAPLNHTSGMVFDCTQYVFGRLNPWCDAFWSGQALTWPWQQNKGVYWAQNRGFNATSRYTWGAPWGHRGARDIAVNAIRAGRVAITGVAAWQHYNVAVAYTPVIYSCPGYQYTAGAWVGFNNGWGESHITWHDQDVIWWASDTRLFRTN